MDDYQRNITITSHIIDKSIKVATRMNDAVHDMGVEMLFDSETMEIQEIRGEMLRVPDVDVCRQTLKGLESLLGLKIGPDAFKQAKKLVGGSQGCSQLVELLRESFHCAFQVRTHHSLDGVPEGRVAEILDELLGGSCIRYKKRQ